MGKNEKPEVPRIPTVFNDGPTRERMRKDGGMEIEVVDRTLSGNVIARRYRARESCLLDKYLRENAITEPMHRAGTRFAFYFFCSGKSPKTTVMYQELIGRSMAAVDHLVEKTDAQKKLDESLKVLTQDERDVVWTVCGQDNKLIKRSDIRQLLTGLRALSIFYGFD